MARCQRTSRTILTAFNCLRNFCFGIRRPDVGTSDSLKDAVLRQMRHPPRNVGAAHIIQTESRSPPDARLALCKLHLCNRTTSPCQTPGCICPGPWDSDPTKCTTRNWPLLLGLGTGFASTMSQYAWHTAPGSLPSSSTLFALRGCWERARLRSIASQPRLETIAS